MFLASKPRNIITPESISTMQYYCLSMAKKEEGGQGGMTKGFVKGSGKRGISVSIGLFCYNAATQMDS